MSQSLVQMYTHLIFSTKNRAHMLPIGIRDELYAYLGGILRNLESPALQIGGEVDHVHVLFSLSKNLALKKVIEEVKKESPKWMKTKGRTFSTFYWQDGYGAFSVSATRVESVGRYIAQQAHHHAKTTFQDEFRQFLKRYKVPYDERYVWD